MSGNSLATIIASLTPTKRHVGTPVYVGLSAVYFPQYSPIELPDVYSLVPLQFRWMALLEDLGQKQLVV